MRRAPIFVAALLPVLAPFSIAIASPLAEAPSAYVRAHAGSPVRFLPWGEAAWARAKAEDKPVYVLVGSFTQELARAMREQSFAREENAKLVNENFIPVVVDRDEHPDLAAFLQAYVGTVKQMQGWPLNVWLTPELNPFEGASYLPPSDEWGKEGFPNALRRVLNAWQTDPQAQRARADENLAALAAAVPSQPPEPADASEVSALLAEATAAWLATYDATNGGFGEPPRRLEPEALRFFLQHDDKAAREAALATLGTVVKSPVRDPLDGGLFRSAGDPAWRQPTLQKILADQARAALALFDSGMPAVANDTLGFAGSLATEKGGYTAALDGTAETIVPSFLWTMVEARAALGGTASARVLESLGISEAGNLPPDAYLGVDATGKNLPRWTVPSPDEAVVTAAAKLRATREKRPAPARDGLASSGVHGLLLAALARSTDDGARAAAARLAAFIRKELILPDQSLRAGPAFATRAAPRDYALVADGLLAFAAATRDDATRVAALALIDKADALFWDRSAGRYLACALPLAPGVGARVPAPAPDAGDLPSAECAMLLALSTHRIGDPERRAALAAAVAADVRDSATIARGDQLLALRAWISDRR